MNTLTPRTRTATTDDFRVEFFRAGSAGSYKVTDLHTGEEFIRYESVVSAGKWVARATDTPVSDPDDIDALNHLATLV